MDFNKLLYYAKCGVQEKLLTLNIGESGPYVEKEKAELQQDLDDIIESKEHLQEAETAYNEAMDDSAEPGLEYGELEQILEILRVHREALCRQIQRFCGKSVAVPIDMADFSETLVELSLRSQKCKALESTVKAILDYLDQENEYESI